MKRIAFGTAVAALGLSALTGCAASPSDASSPSDNGISQQPAATVLSTALSNAKNQATVHIKGKGTCPGISTYGVDMKLTSQGTATGTINTYSGTSQVVATPQKIYIHANKSFWAAQTTAAEAAQIGDRWVAFAPAANACYAALTSFTDILENYVDVPGTATKEKSTSVYGVPAQLIAIPPDFSVWVATTGEPLPVYISSPSVALTMTMGEWGQPVSVTAPTNTVDGATVIKQ